MSVMSISTVTCRFSSMRTLARSRGAGVAADRRRHAEPDQPLAVLQRARHAGPLVPAELGGALLQALDQLAGREGHVLLGILGRARCAAAARPDRGRACRRARPSPARCASWPTASPGARIESATGMSSGTTRWRVSRLGAAYIERVLAAALSTYSSMRADCDIDLVGDRGQLAVRAGRQPHALDGGGAVGGDRRTSAGASA